MDTTSRFESPGESVEAAAKKPITSSIHLEISHQAIESQPRGNETLLHFAYILTSAHDRIFHFLGAV